jgi:phosphatidylserine decarboxylase
MTLNFDPDLNTNQVLSSGPIVNKKALDGIRMNAGQEVGRFNMGSTVVAVVEVPKGYKFNIKEGQAVRYGDLIGSVPSGSSE